MRSVSPGSRHCEMCAQDVYDLTRLSEAEIRAQVFERSERVCVRFVERQDGTLVTSDCAPVRHRRMRSAGRLALRPAAWLVRAALAMLAAFGVARAADFGPSSWFAVQPHVLVNLQPSHEEEDVRLVMGLLAPADAE